MHRNVLLGLLSLLVLLVLCPYCRAPAIEEDIRTRTAAALAAADFAEGQLSVSGRDVTLAGVVPSDEAREQAGKVAADVWGVRTVQNLLEVAPHAARVFIPGTLWFIKQGPRLTLRGEVPGDDLLAGLVSAAYEVWGAAGVNDELSVNPGLDRSGWPDWLDKVVGALHLRRGDLTIELAGSSAIIEGSVLSELTKSRILGAAEVLLPGFDIVDRITVKEPEGDLETLQHRLDAMLSADAVEFESDSARLTPAGIAVLEDVAELLREYPGRVQISGHTDSQASPEYNLDLSRQRAESARDYLVSAGFKPGRFVTVGYGEARPVATNETAEGRQRNRRTEFHVLEEN